MTTRKLRSIENQKAHAIERTIALGHKPVDPNDASAEPRPTLAPIPWNKVAMTDEVRDAVAHALMEGYPRNQIAMALGITVTTLRRFIKGDDRLRDAIEVRKDAEEAELRDLLMGMARKGDTVAAIFLAKAQFGWRDRDDVRVKSQEHQVGVLVVPAAVPLDEWEAAAARQQAKFRRRDLEEPAGLEVRTHTKVRDELRMQQLLPGDLPN